MKNDRVLRIYTDGACSGNQNDENVGGWGAVLQFAGHEKELCGGEVNTTNNRMEMTGLLEALRAIKKPDQSIEVYCDSSYLMNCFREKWYVRWQKNGWLNSKKEAVENRDLWEALLPFLDEHDFRFYRVKGHVNVDWHIAQSKDSDAFPASLQKTYDKFCEWNGKGFTTENFIYITRMNNRADALANQGMDAYR